MSTPMRSSSAVRSVSEPGPLSSHASSWIPNFAPELLRRGDGRYQLRVTNELEEVLYLDRIQLVAIDHPQDVRVYPDEGLTESPKRERSVAARDPRAVRAHDDSGRDVSARLRELDRSFVDELPVERIRDGYYTDAYFNYTKELLELGTRDPRVVMQVFQRKESLLGAVDEAIAVLRECAGRHAEDGSWVGAWEELEVKALYEDRGQAISAMTPAV